MSEILHITPEGEANKMSYENPTFSQRFILPSIVSSVITVGGFVMFTVFGFGGSAEKLLRHDNQIQRLEDRGDKYVMKEDITRIEVQIQRIEEKIDKIVEDELQQRRK